MDLRYIAPEMARIWSDRTRNAHERTLWIEILKALRDQGVAIPDEAITDYQAAAEAIAALPEDIELRAVAELEREHGHDLYARLQYFNVRAGHDWAHRGLTSSDITENIQQSQLVAAATLLYAHGEQVALRWAALVRRHAGHATVGRTHGRPAQVTTIGKRVADRLCALVDALHALEAAVDGYQQRGVKGAVGTGADLAAVAEGTESPQHVAQTIDMKLGLGLTGGSMPPLVATGQCYPRGNDLPILAGVLQVAAACEAFATDVRLLSMLELATETSGQVGSSAMPHKRNPRYSERVCGLAAVARGYFAMLGQVQPWLEGDVSTSALRRVALPGLMQAVDAILANTAHIADVVRYSTTDAHTEVERLLPQLATGELLETVLRETDLTRAEAHEALRGASADLAMLADPSGYARFVRLHPGLGLTVDSLAGALDRHRKRAIAGARSACDMVLLMLDDEDEPDPQWPGTLL